MRNLTMYCLSMNDNHYNLIKKFDYIPVGLGKDNFSSQWLRDNTGKNISQKNKYYGEYTFHYWIWKNYLDKIDDGWTGFCQYRKFWSLDKINKLPKSIDHLDSLVLKDIPKEYEDFNVILGEPMFINKLKVMKFLKRGLKIIIKNPSCLINKDKRNIKFHFDMWHGQNYLTKAIKLLDRDNREDFTRFVETQCSFNPENMFICKSKKIIKNYYNSIFPWLKRCEKVFGFKSDSYGKTRIYGFLAERYLSFWFNKYTKPLTWPIIWFDINDINSKS